MTLHGIPGKRLRTVRAAILKAPRYSPDGWGWIGDEGLKYLTKKRANKFLFTCILNYQMDADYLWARCKEFLEVELNDPDCLWDVVAEVPLSTWLILLSAQIIVTRIPLIPNRGLLFASTSLGLSNFVQIPPVQLAAMLLTSTVLDKVLNLTLFTTFSVLKNERESPDGPSSARFGAPWAGSPGLSHPQHLS